LVVGVVAIVCLSLGGRAVQLSFADDERYRAFSTDAFAAEPTNAAKEEAGRGAVVSADGQRLATSLNAGKVIATPYQVEDPEATAESLAEVIGDKGGDAAGMEEKLAEKDDDGAPSGYSVVAEGIEPENAREVSKLGLPGISVVPDEVRVYPNGPLASQLIGYLGTDEAYGGVEARYDEALESGQEVKLTLDTAVQQELEGALGESAQKYEGKRALGIVMRVDDGAIVALANTPGYDNNEFAESSEEDKRDRVVDPYEPGSTFKPFTMAAALEEGAVSEQDSFVVADSIPVADVVIRDSEPHATEVLDPAGILQHSRNVGTIQVAQALGGERLVEYIKRFGFGEGTGVDLWGENAGIVPAFEEWSGSSIGNIPIGQGLTVTPLQLASGYASLVNGGLRVTPHVAQGATLEGLGSRVISEKTSSIVRGMLQSVVEEGTGHLARIPGYTVAGKTGTAQKVDPETGLYGDEYITSFVGFAPAQDPEYLTLIVVDEPQVEIWGEVVAAPAFQKVMGFTLGYFNVPPDHEATKNDTPPPDVPTRPGTIKTRGWAP
jgi:cell division protein FtsI (penicillin-binding protein 3)